MPAFVCRIEISEILLFLCFVYRASLYNRLQIKPTSYTYFLLYLFSLLYMFRASICPSSGELTVSLWHWYLTLCHSVWVTVRSVQTGQPLIQSDKYQCHKDTVSSPDDGHIVTLSICMSGCLVCADRTATHAEWQSDKYQCHKDTVSSPDDGHIDAWNMYRRENNIVRNMCAYLASFANDFTLFSVGLKRYNSPSVRCASVAYDISGVSLWKVYWD